MVMHDNELHVIKDKIKPQHMHSGDKCESSRAHAVVGKAVSANPGLNFNGFRRHLDE